MESQLRAHDGEQTTTERHVRTADVNSVVNTHSDSPAPATMQMLLSHPSVSRQAVLQMQRSHGNRAVVQMLAGGGERLPEGVRVQMSRSLGADFSGVRVHRDSAAAPALGAVAFAQGADVHFAPGAYRPDTASGLHTIGHELTHVVQQRQGRVASTQQAMGLDINADPALEREADVLGGAAARGEPAGGGAGAAAVDGGGPVQRRLLMGGNPRDAEWVDALDEDDFTAVLKGKDFDRVKNVLKGWAELDASNDRDFPGQREMVVAAVASLGARDASEVDFATLEGAGFDALTLDRLHGILGDHVMGAAADDGGAGLFGFFGVADLNGIAILRAAIPNDYALAAIITDGDVDDLVAWATTLGIGDFVAIIQGKPLQSVKNLCQGLGIDNVATRTTGAARALMDEPLVWLQALAGQWASMRRLVTSAADVAEIVALVPALCTWAEAGTLGGLAMSDGGFSATQLRAMRANSLSAAILIGYLTEATQYGEAKAETSAIINLHPNDTAVNWSTFLRVHVGGKVDISGSEIYKLYLDGHAAITWYKTKHTGEEAVKGGATLFYSIRIFGAPVIHEIHIHYNKGQNSFAEYAAGAAHIKPDPGLDIRHYIPHALALALIAQPHTVL